MIIAFSIGYEDHTAHYEVDAELLAKLLDVYMELEGSEVEYETEDEVVDFDSINFLEFEEEDAEEDAEEAEDDGVIYDVDGTAWWFCDEDEIWYFFDEEEDDWVVYDEDAAAW
jgi:hypothetical protein